MAQQPSPERRVALVRRQIVHLYGENAAQTLETTAAANTKFEDIPVSQRHMIQTAESLFRSRSRR